MRELLTALAAAILAVLVILIGLAVAGHPPGPVLATAWSGVAGSPVRLAICLQEATPLLLTGLAAAIAFRAGVLNIGLEGQYLMGAVAALAVLTSGPVGWPVLVLAGLAGALAGALWCAVAVFLERARGVPIVLATILLNVVAAHLVGILVQGPLHDPGTSAPQSALVPEANRIPALVANTGLHVGAILAVVLALIAWVVQRQTPVGFELRVLGLNPVAAEHAGIPAVRRQGQVALVSGALAGLAGMLQVAGVTFFLATDVTSYGYAGIAVALLGRLHPLGIIPAALFFAGLDVGARQLERREGIPHDLGDLAKGLTVAAVLVAGALAARRAR